jgi:hypothetical protein
MGGALFAGVIMIMAGVFWALEGLAGCSRCVASTSMMHMCVDSAWHLHGLTAGAARVG